MRHGSDLGFVPVVVTDACGAGPADAGERAIANMRFMGDAMLCTTDELKGGLGGPEAHIGCDIGPYRSARSARRYRGQRF